MITFKETTDAAEILLERQLTPKEYKKFKKQLMRMVGKSFRGRLDLIILRITYLLKKLARILK